MSLVTNQDGGITELRRRIGGAFPDIPFSGPITKVDGLMNEELDEQRALYRALRGRRWSEIDATFIQRYPDGVVLLTDESFVAFLPAWLSAAIVHKEVREFITYVFSPRDKDSLDFVDRRMKCLTPTQRESLRDVFSYFAHLAVPDIERKPATSALEYVTKFNLNTAS